MRKAVVWWLRFCILGLGFTGCRTVLSSDLLLIEIMEFSKTEFLENEASDFQIPEILSSREYDELSKKNPEVFKKIRDLSKSEGKDLLVEQVKLGQLDRYVVDAIEAQLSDPDFRTAVEEKGEGTERFTNEAKAGIVFLLLSLNQAWGEEEAVRVEVRHRVSKALRSQGIELPERRPGS
jgi:hypothetical protein